MNGPPCCAANCSPLAARCQGSVLRAFFGRLIAYSAASPRVRMVLPSGIGTGLSKRRDQFTPLYRPACHRLRRSGGIHPARVVVANLASFHGASNRRLSRSQIRPAPSCRRRGTVGVQPHRLAFTPPASPLALKQSASPPGEGAPTGSGVLRRATLGAAPVGEPMLRLRVRSWINSHRSLQP